MTAEDLIEKLKQYNPNAEVRLLTGVDVTDQKEGDEIEYFEPAQEVRDWGGYITIE